MKPEETVNPDVKKFKKKPVEISAVQFDKNNKEKTDRLVHWCGGALFAGEKLNIKTLEGTMTADHRDWIIQGVNGEFYPCKPDIFSKTYETVGGK